MWGEVGMDSMGWGGGGGSRTLSQVSYLVNINVCDEQVYVW